MRRRRSGNIGNIRIDAGLIVIGLIVFYFAVLIRADWVKVIELKAEKARLAAEIDFAAKQKQGLTKKISFLETADYIEILAREKLGLIKPGETAYKVVR